ncbi:LLM class flavin-dependent oxidoreductase [Agrococcus jejuensis]|uniref:Probable oxidoreductase, LLM family n=1 Tax=Agrococcus jejuensis TaxID=399736 RepID=A0A1G8H175_9MICO|nr:LLM class flavin-dependent oxidoreductase [Agrococcus jejuensis]SDI00393.1 probable oxidoreductase, LLM family [Agrococcus jejuensis]
MLQFGLHTFGDVLGAEPDAHPRTIREVVAEGVLADRVGVDFLGLGEHHRADFALTAPEIVLGALATATERIRLGTAVTVLSSADPVRVFEQFATIDGLSNGRAELIVGRGSFVESFPLFGFRLEDYETLFEERLELLAALVAEEPVTWSGTLRASLADQQVWPRSQASVAGGRMPVWVGVGGRPQSVVRTARYGFDLMLAVIGGSPKAFAPFASLYRDAMERFEHEGGRVGLHSPGLVAETDAEARELLRPHWIAQRNRIGAERGWGPASVREFDDAASDDGALFVGSPETVAAKIVRAVGDLGLDRFDLKYASGTPHAANLRTIELFGTEVMPRVRAALGD